MLSDLSQVTQQSMVEPEFKPRMGAPEATLLNAIVSVCVCVCVYDAIEQGTQEAALYGGMLEAWEWVETGS